MRKTKTQSIYSQLIAFYFVVLPGFEPGQTGPESVVLPLHHRTIFVRAKLQKYFFKSSLRAFILYICKTTKKNCDLNYFIIV